MTTNELNNATETKFNGHMAKIQGVNGEWIGWVINAGTSKNGVALVKIRERVYQGMTGTSCRIVYGYAAPIWIRAEKVIRTWAKR